MRASAPRNTPKVSGEALSDLALTHGQTIRLMTELGLHQGVSTSTFNYYIKSLRKLGVPFEKGKGQSEGHRHVTYDFEDLMELTVALLLRVYGILPDAVVAGLRHFRAELRPIYRQAYLDSLAQTFAPARLSEKGGNRASLTGLFLDLNIRFSSGHLIEFGPPTVMSPFEAVRTFARSQIPARSYLPMNISVVAETLVAHARALPVIRHRRSPSRRQTSYIGRH